MIRFLMDVIFYLILILFGMSLASDNEFNLLVLLSLAFLWLLDFFINDRLHGGNQ